MRVLKPIFHRYPCVSGINDFNQSRISPFIRRGGMHHPVVAVDQLCIRTGQRAAPRVRVVIADVDEHPAEPGDAGDLHHAAVQLRVAPPVKHVHARPGIEPQPVPAGGNSRAARHLHRPQAVLQQVAAEQPVDVQVAQRRVPSLRHADDSAAHGAAPSPLPALVSGVPPEALSPLPRLSATAALAMAVATSPAVTR